MEYLYYYINQIKDFFTDMDLQRKLILIISIIFLFLIILLIISMFTYEQDIEDVIEQFIVASENMNTSQLLSITTGVIHENLIKQDKMVNDIKKQIHFTGSLSNYDVNYFEKQTHQATVEVVAEIREKMVGKSSRTFEHIFVLQLINIRNEWKIANIRVVKTIRTG